MEIKIRFGFNNVDLKKPLGKVLEWDSFFDMHDIGKGKYSLKDISIMTREEFKNIVDEFYYRVYYQYYMENGIVNIQQYNPDILSWMGLPSDSGEKEIKKRFRELAKLFHPDTGGDERKFIELMKNYRKLVD